MRNDDFARAARAKAWERNPEPVDVETGEPVDDWGFEERGRKDFLAGAEWALTYLTEEEPTDAEVEASRLALHQALASDWMSIANVLGGDQREYEALLGDLARAALSTARAARRDQEK